MSDQHYRPELSRALGKLMMPLVQLIKTACPGIEVTAELMAIAPRDIEGVLVGINADALYVTVEGWRLRIGVEGGDITPATPDVIGKLRRLPWSPEY